jgi:hypothetical protein
MLTMSEVSKHIETFADNDQPTTAPSRAVLPGADGAANELLRECPLQG